MAKTQTGAAWLRRRAAGFTLIELMIVVVIIAILAAIAYPAYTNYVVRTNKAAAQQFLLEAGNRQEQVMMDRRVYEDSMSDLNITAPDRVSAYYDVSVANVSNSATPPSFQLNADPKSGTMQEGEPTLEYHSDGTKKPSDEWE